MKILFGMSSPEYLRYYDSTLSELAARGHDIVIAANAIRDLKPVRFDAIAGANTRIADAGTIPTRGDVWAALARWVRGTMDFVRYLHPRLASASVLRARMKRQGLPLVLQWVDRVRTLDETTIARVMKALALVERAIPVGQPLVQFLDAHHPDLVLVSPLVEAASEQVDLVKAAQARGVPVAACIASWDNLTNKGDLRIATDLVVVWNDAQKREAVEFHRVPPEKVVVTGSQVFDRWFDREPSRSRDTFCRTVGLPAEKPFVLFVGSSVFISRADVEVPFVRRWIEALRQSVDPAVRELGVLIRPHPYNGAQWANADLSGLGDVAVWPKGRHNPVDEINRADFFDSMHHSEAVVGINTSAMIEATIVGRPVLSILTPEFAGSQEGTLHFHYLLPENGGFLRVASSFDEHVRQLGGILRDPGAARAELARFVRSFIRPHGVDRASTPIIADALEQSGQFAARAPLKDSAGVQALRVALYPIAMLAYLFPEETLRKNVLSRWARQRRRQAERTRHALAKRGVGRARAMRRSVTLAARGARRLADAVFLAMTVRPRRQTARALRLVRYRLGVIARRLRGITSHKSQIANHE